MHSPLGINQGSALKEAVVCRTSASFVAEAGSYAVNEAGECRKRERVFKAVLSETPDNWILSMPSLCIPRFLGA